MSLSYKEFKEQLKLVSQAQNQRYISAAHKMRMLDEMDDRMNFARREEDWLAHVARWNEFKRKCKNFGFNMLFFAIGMAASYLYFN